jgi:D-glycerate 3-kinase
LSDSPFNPWDAALVAALAGAIADTRARLGRPVLIGISGVQGSGKSTLCAQLEAALSVAGLRAATLSLDDLYLTRAERLRLGDTQHPLFVTRGVPGTHDLALADTVIARLLTGEGPVAIPRFDKAVDDRTPERDWPLVTAPLDVLLFEGWCIAATPEPESALVTPVNALEADEDPDGGWRRVVNAALGGGYAALFARIDLLILLRAPGFSAVQAWRQQQEDALRARRGAGAGMDASALGRFIAHFERVSRHMLAASPPPGAIIVGLDADRRVGAVIGLPASAP